MQRSCAGVRAGLRPQFSYFVLGNPPASVLVIRATALRMACKEGDLPCRLRTTSRIYRQVLFWCFRKYHALAASFMESHVKQSVPWLPFGLTVHGTLRLANPRICCPSSNFRLAHQDGNSEYLGAANVRLSRQGGNSEYLSAKAQMFKKFGQQMLHAQCAQTLRISGAQIQPTLGQMRKPFRSRRRRGFSKRKPLRISGAQNQLTLGQTRNQRGAEVFTRSEDWPLYNTTAGAGDFSAPPLHCSVSPGPASGVVEESTGGRGGLGNISPSDKKTTPENK